MQHYGVLVLEISRHGDYLKMSLYERTQTSPTLKQFNQHQVSFKEIENFCREITSILNSSNTSGELKDAVSLKELAKIGQLLWEHLLTAPIKKALINTNSADLVLQIDEELVHIPWELLYNGRNFLCLIFNLGRVVRTTRQIFASNYRGHGSFLKMLILANPTADLKSAYLEGLNIKNQFDHRRDRVRIDFKSTYVERLYVKKRIHDYDLVHFAGHCEYEEDDIENSGWVLSDGRFTIHDITTMSGSTAYPSLIFSNGCCSAKSKDIFLESDYHQKNYNLASAFLFSGVRHYIGSIRRISDSESFLFAKEFYNQILSGESIGEALRLSRLKLIKEKGITDIHWLSYLLYGDPSFSFFQARVKRRRILDLKPVTLLLKKYSRLVIAVALGFFLMSCIWGYLPTRNPNAYFLFLNSRNAFLNGRNDEVIRLSRIIINKDPAFLSIYPLLADAYHRSGDSENALKNYFNYALYSEKKKDYQNLACAYLRIGWFYHLGGNLNKAFEFYKKALSLARKHNDKMNEADAMGKLAVWHIDKEEYDKAMELLLKSSEINRQRKHMRKYKYNLACDYFNLGLLFINKDDYAAAKEFYDKSFVLFSELKMVHELSDYYYNIGEIYLFQKEYQKAMDCYLQGLRIDQEQGHKPNIAGGYIMIGELYSEMDSFKEAERYFKEGIKLAKDLNLRLEIASGCYNLGLLYRKIGRKNRAREYLRQAQEIYSQINTLRYQEIKELLISQD